MPTGTTGAAGNNGSANFAVVYSGYGCITALSFTDGEERVIDHLYITNTSYVLSVCDWGSDDSAALGSENKAWVTVTGYDQSGNSVGELTYDLASGLGERLTEWQKWDLSSLGAVCKIEFFCGSDVYYYGSTISSIPPNIAIDDIAVQF